MSTYRTLVHLPVNILLLTVTATEPLYRRHPLLGNDSIPFQSDGYVRNNNYGLQVSVNIPLDGSMVELARALLVGMNKRCVLITNLFVHLNVPKL